MRPGLRAVAVALVSAFALVSALALACRPVVQCRDDAECGLLEACIEDRCREVECVGSGDCAIGEHCVADTHLCEPGCAYDSDCRVVETCDPTLRACVPAGCVDTQVDCEFGEVCDHETGSCHPDPRPLCEDCQDDYLCENGGVCMYYGNSRYFCTFECNPEDRDGCPQGFPCSVWGDRHFCAAYCPMAEEILR